VPPISAAGAHLTSVRPGDCGDVTVNGGDELGELEDGVGLDGDELGELEDGVGLDGDELGELEDGVGLDGDELADVGVGVGDGEVTIGVTANPSAETTVSLPAAG